MCALCSGCLKRTKFCCVRKEANRGWGPPLVRARMSWALSTHRCGLRAFWADLAAPRHSAASSSRSKCPTRSCHNSGAHKHRLIPVRLRPSATVQVNESNVANSRAQCILQVHGRAPLPRPVALVRRTRRARAPRRRCSVCGVLRQARRRNARLERRDELVVLHTPQAALSARK